MWTWGTVVGIVAGFIIAIGGFLMVGAIVAALFRWATTSVRPQDPALDDEDEIDHRFY